MKILPLAAVGLLAAAGSVARAETIVVDDQVALRETSIAMPTRGARMQAVESKFGAPSARHPAVGKPPITRWDYPGFSVFFENDLVLHSVAAAP